MTEPPRTTTRSRNHNHDEFHSADDLSYAEGSPSRLSDDIRSGCLSHTPPRDAKGAASENLVPDSMFLAGTLGAVSGRASSDAGLWGDRDGRAADFRCGREDFVVLAADVCSV
jgi:hypothetical protein